MWSTAGWAVEAIKGSQVEDETVSSEDKGTRTTAGLKMGLPDGPAGVERLVSPELKPDERLSPSRLKKKKNKKKR